MTMDPWPDPWQWTELRRVRRHLRIASLCMGFAIAALVPSAWILLMPTDPTLRPDLTATLAWIGVGVSAVVGYSGHTLARLARARFDQAIYGLNRATRDCGIARNIPLEIDVGEIYPPAQLSRQHRMIGIGGPEPLLLSLDEIKTMEVSDGRDTTHLPREPHLIIHLTRTNPAYLIMVPGRGLSRANQAQVETLRDRLNEFVEPHAAWNDEQGNKIDLAAFVESMRPVGRSP